MSTVKVALNPKTNQVFTPGKTPGWGTVRVDSESTTVNNGILNRNRRSAFIRMKEEDFKAIGWNAGTVIAGKIVRETSTVPFWDSQTPVSNPETAEVVLRNGAPYYQNFVFTQVGTDTDIEITPEQMAERTAGVAAKVQVGG